MSDIKLAIAGVGNAAAALVEGIVYYSDDDRGSSGLLTETLGGYRVSDITPVCAFDVDSRKVGTDLIDAMAVNDYARFADLPDEIWSPVYQGPLSDGVATHMERGDTDAYRVPHSEQPVDVADKLRAHDVDVLVNYLPAGADDAAGTYPDACLDAGVALVNGMSASIASDADWRERFENRELPVVGDDIKPQFGGTTVHRGLLGLLDLRGVDVESTYQLNAGGNTDVRNTLDEDRGESKMAATTAAVRSQLGGDPDDVKVHLSHSEYVPWLGDNELAFVRIEGKKFGGAPMSIDLTLDVEDSRNAAGSAVDAIRAAKAALDEGQSGALVEISAFTMERPPEQLPDETAHGRIPDYPDRGG